MVARSLPPGEAPAPSSPSCSPSPGSPRSGRAARPSRTSRAQRGRGREIEDLEKAGKRNNPRHICSDILAKELVDQLKAGGTTARPEMQKAIEDADDFDLEVSR